MPEASPDDVVEVARHLLARPDMADALVMESGVVASAVPVLHPFERSQVAWFVPVTVGELLAGFFVLTTQLSLQRWSTFQRHRGTLDGCPDAADWLSPERIAARAVQSAGAGVSGVAGVAGTPYLSYDTVPDRIAWIVPVGEAAIFVAGTTTWPATS
jgi:hypothetical protein